MATRATQGGPSGLPTLPPIKKGRVRKAQGVWTGAGELSLNTLLMREETPPANVTRIKPLSEPSPLTRSPEALLVTLIFAELPPERREAILHHLQVMAYVDRCPDALALIAVMKRREE